jgi:thioredoxin reductase (NADPH)
VTRVESVRVRTYARLLGASRENGRIRCLLGTRGGEESLVCERLILATGYFDHANRLDVPGEDLPHVSHWFDEPHLTAGQDVVIVGGKNSAVEAALLCFRAGARVTLVHRGKALKPTVKYWLAPDFINRVKANEIAARFGARVQAITSAHVNIRNAEDRDERLPADRVYLLTGYQPDFALFRSIGIGFDEETGRPSLDPHTLETNVPGVYLAGSVTAGRKISEVFIENGRFDGEKIFGDSDSRRRADDRYRDTGREVGE